MNKIIAENRLLKADMGLLNQRTEKLKQAQNKIQSLEKELNEKKEQLADVEKQKAELLAKKSQFEDMEFHYINRQKQLEGRYKALNEQLDETIIEN